MQTKLEQLKAAWASCDTAEALRIAARFPRLGEAGPAIQRAHQAQWNPAFYRQIGRDPGGRHPKKLEANLMNRLKQADLAPRCSATSKRTGCPCRAPAVKGWKVCRFHGAKSGAPKGKANGAWQGGRWAADAAADRRALGDLMRASRAMMKRLG